MSDAFRHFSARVATVAVSHSDDRKSGHLYEQDGGLADGAPQPDTVWSMRFSLKHDDATGAAQAPSFDVPVVVSTSKRFHTWFPFGGARVGDSIAVMHQVRFLTEILDDFRRFVDEIWRF